MDNKQSETLERIETILLNIDMTITKFVVAVEQANAIKLKEEQLLIDERERDIKKFEIEAFSNRIKDYNKEANSVGKLPNRKSKVRLEGFDDKIKIHNEIIRQVEKVNKSKAEKIKKPEVRCKCGVTISKKNGKYDELCSYCRNVIKKTEIKCKCGVVIRKKKGKYAKVCTYCKMAKRKAKAAEKRKIKKINVIVSAEELVALKKFRQYERDNKSETPK